MSAGDVLDARELGSGAPLVLINGYAGAAEDWDPAFLDALASTSSVLCPDHRGMGDSPAIEGELSALTMARDILALMDDRGIERAAVAGWSMGGFVAQELAATAPERVTHLVLLATSRGGRDALLADRETFARLVDHSGTPREQATRLLALLFPPDTAAKVDAEFGELVAAARARLSEDTLNAQEEVMADWYREPAEARLGRIVAPALAAAGTEDIVIPPGNSVLLSERLAGSWLARFKGTGHAFMAQEPQRLAALINAFVGR